MTDDADTLRDQLAANLAALEELRRQPAGSIIAQFEGVPPPRPAAQYDQHLYDRTEFDARQWMEERTAQLAASTATAHRFLFEQAERQGRRPFEVVKDDEDGEP